MFDSTDRGVGASPSCDSDVLGPSQTGYAEKELIAMPPEDKLRHFDSRARAHEDTREVGAASRRVAVTNTLCSGD